MFSALFSVVVASLAWAQVGESVDAPSFKPGDSWTYVRTDKLDRSRNAKYSLTVKSVSDSGHVTSRELLEGSVSASDDEYTREMNPIVFEGQKFDPYVQVFSFPLAPGKQWEGKYSFWSSAVNLQFNGSRANRVEGWETVRTPAGEFKALKITFAGHARNQYGRGSEFQGTWWYSPEVRRFVRAETKAFGGAPRDELIELVSFKPAQ
jgi:hypothetical protein